MSDIASVMHAKALGLSLPNDGAVPMGNLSLLEAFARRFLDPEDLGHSVSKYTRDQARVALGRPAVESNQFQRDQQVGVSPAMRHQISPRKHHIHPQEQSMTTPDQSIDSAIVAAGATKAPRIKPVDIEANIASESYFTAADGLRGASVGKPGESLLPEYATYEGSPLSLLTFCVLTLRNGFTVTGESACASPENYNAEIGRRRARENAVAKVWAFMGYELRTRIATGRTTIADRSGN